MIYFIQETGFLRSRVKIGFSDNPKTRLAQAQTQSPSRLRVLLILEGDKDTEALYHRKFERYRKHGEWFAYGFWLRWFVWANWGRAIGYEVPVQTDDLIAEFGDINIEPNSLDFDIPDITKLMPASEDDVKRFIDECLVLTDDKGDKIQASVLQDMFGEWCKGWDVEPDKTLLSTCLHDRKRKTGGVNVYSGLKIKDKERA